MAVAVAASPLAPLGQLHRLEPDPGVSFDWTVLGAGATFFLLAPVRRGGGAGPCRSLSTLSAARRGFPPVDRGGNDGATDPAGHRSRRIGRAFASSVAAAPRPARPSISGTVVALIVLVGSLVFGASLSNLVSHPALYGWTWDREILAGSGYGNIPLPQARLLLGHDPDIAAWSGAYFDSVEINRHSVPVIATTNARVSPPILAGHALAGPTQIVLGPETLALVGAHVGGTVRVFNGKTTLIMRVAGTATMPAIGVGHGIHSSLGGGAVLPAAVLLRLPADNRHQQSPIVSPTEHDPGPLPPGRRSRRCHPAARADRRPAIQDPVGARHPGAARPAASRDRQLPDDGHCAARSRRDARSRGCRGARPDPRRLGPAPVA